LILEDLSAVATGDVCQRLPSSPSYSATRVYAVAIRTAESWTIGNIAGGLLLLVLISLALAAFIRVTLRR